MGGGGGGGGVGGGGGGALKMSSQFNISGTNSKISKVNQQSVLY